MKRFFDDEIKDLRSKIILMGDKVTEMTNEAITALIEGNVDLAKKVIGTDDEVDNLEVEIDNDAVRYISLRAPVAKDVRIVTICMKISNNLERIGDEATSIAKRVLKLGRQKPPNSFLELGILSELAVKALRLSLESYIEGDAVLAKDLPGQDKELDRLHRKNYDGFTELISQNSEFSAQFVELILASKSLERIGDHASNIAVEVYYLLEAKDLRHHGIADK
jgi:phosphate transport system protein|tara:strand:- start:4950 stop:5615 length:666 start_codon:yes stop_codon:yes gene_type:complete